MTEDQYKRWIAALTVIINTLDVIIIAIVFAFMIMGLVAIVRAILY